MRIRRIAVFIDGGFFLKRLPKIVEPKYRENAEQVAKTAGILCKRHVQRLVGKREQWLDHVYRLFYYDARPYEGQAHHPLRKRQIDYGKTDEARFRNELFAELRKKRKFALRLGQVEKLSGWQIRGNMTAKLLETRHWYEMFETIANGQAFDPQQLSDESVSALNKLARTWRELSDKDISYGLRQKGVDMRLGIDVTSITLKQQADTLILVTGDSDFVPAAKLARREGAEVILDPLGQQVRPQLHEHIDELCSVLTLGSAGDTNDLKNEE